jgi:hypothetical protein
MNPLTKVLVKDLLEAENKKVTAIYGGGFKPPTKGHFDVVKTATEQNPEIDEFIIYVGGGVRDGIAQAESIMIWEIYKKYLPLKVRVEAVKTPVGDILRYAKDHPDEDVLWVIGARENNPEDFADIASRTRTMEKYPNLQLRVIQTTGGVSGTAARKAVRDNNKEQFFHLIPDIEEKNQVWDIVSPIITEGIIDNAKEKLKKFISAIKQESKETKEAFSLLIKSAKGDIDLTEEQKKQIGDQLKDVLKLVGLTAIATLPGGFIAAALIKLFKAEHLITPSSMMTELVTATEIICDNCGWKWAKKDGGNDLYICHKCGHDNAPKQLTENSIPSIDIKSKLKQLDKYMLDKGYNIEPLPTVELIDNDVENAENFLGRTAYYDPNEKKIVLYTYGRHPKDICRSYTHEMVHHIQNLEDRLGDVSTTNTLEDDHVADLEKEANLTGTMTFRNFTDSLKENKDPFGLNAYARELALGLEEKLNEGRYDSIVTQLARYTIKGWKDDQEHGEPTGRVEFEVGPGKDLEYGDLEFLYKGVAIFSNVELYSHNGYARANSGEVGITFSIPTSELPKMWERVYNDVTNTLRHEIEHLTQSGKNVKPNKAMASDSDVRNKMKASDKQDPDYFLLPKEIDANLQGLYLKAKKIKQPFSKVVDNYLKYDLNLSLDDQEKVKNAWRSRIKALSLPKI